MLVRILAFAAAGLTLALIVAGGLVTNTDSGLACPDWPLCFGSPLPKMVGGVAIEHTHRLIAGGVGFFTALLTLLLLKRDGQAPLGWLATLGCTPLVLGGAFTAAAGVSRTGSLPAIPAALAVLGLIGLLAIFARAHGVTRLSVLALLLVLAQGLLGGLTVVYRLPPTILVLHLGTSMLFFSTLLFLALRLGASPRAPADPALSAPAPEGRALALLPARPGLIWATTAAAYLQILLGATVRHTGAGLVCTDLPLCRGALWPLGVHPAVHLHMAHRALALVVAGLVIAVAVRHWSSADGQVRRLARVAPALVGVQIVLGVLTIATFKELVSVTGHLLFAALLLGTLVALLVRTLHPDSTSPQVAPATPDRAPDGTGLVGAQS